MFWPDGGTIVATLRSTPKFTSSGRASLGLTAMLALKPVRSTNTKVLAQPIKGTPWILITRIDLAEAEAPVQRLRFVVTVLACLFILFSAAVTYLLWRTQHDHWVAGRALLAQRYDTAIEAQSPNYKLYGTLRSGDGSTRSPSYQRRGGITGATQP